jgi:hypothetical protein
LVGWVGFKTNSGGGLLKYVPTEKNLCL